jgi:hypothetical protein
MMELKGDGLAVGDSFRRLACSRCGEGRVTDRHTKEIGPKETVEYSAHEGKEAEVRLRRAMILDETTDVDTSNLFQ